MANPEHLEILKQGVEVWNEWRNESDVIPDLSHTWFLAGRNLTGINLKGANLYRADLNGVNLSDAILRNTNLGGTLLNAAIIRHAFISTSFEYADLIGADLTDSIIIFSTFWETKLAGANFLETRFQANRFNETDLSEVKNLEFVIHYSGSSIDIDTIYRSKGKIPEVFLRGCGVPENFITYMRSLTGQALEFYKCFVSFTEADDLFSERLYNDLQCAGVRCWRWKEDAKWGKTLMSSIDEAVKIHDKLIVICSEQSLNSPAVIREIERALQKEDDLARLGKDAEVLFPIRLDDYIFTEWNHHRKADVVAKNVGDFRNWNEPERYKKAFDRLLRDLKAEEKKP